MLLLSLVIIFIYTMLANTFMFDTISIRKIKSYSYDCFEPFYKNKELKTVNFTLIHVNIRSLRKY